MMRLAIAAAAAAMVLAGCQSAGDVANNEDAFSVTEIDGVRCIVFKPYTTSGDGASMDCDFFGEADE